jgi:hypothetical protein
MSAERKLPDRSEFVAWTQARFAAVKTRWECWCVADKIRWRLDRMRREGNHAAVEQVREAAHRAFVRLRQTRITAFVPLPEIPEVAAQVEKEKANG